MTTSSLLPDTRVTTYEGRAPVDRYFRTPEAAADWLVKSGTQYANVYRIEKVNGTWRTDWELTT